MVRTRIAPSPTGNLHIGVARAAIFNFLFARQNQGEFILRIEDTDATRSTKEFEKNIIDSLSWLGMEWDNDIARQSERTAHYAPYIAELKDKGLAYEEPAREGSGVAVVLKKSAGDAVFQDLIRGSVSFPEDQITDLVIQKPDGSPTYNFAVVIDDHEMGITHVIRGEDHIANTPKQLIVYQALGWDLPQFAHLPLILASDRSKLSKRHGATSVTEFKEEGYLPEAMVNFMALLGWHPKDEQEIFTLAELIESFRLEDVQKGGAVFDKNKLDWINQQHIQRLSIDEYTKRVEEFLGQSIPEELLKMTKERITKLADIKEEMRWTETPNYEAELLVWKETPREQIKQNLTVVLELLTGLPDSDWTDINKIEEKLMPFADEQGRGEVLWPLRVALSGRDKSPSPFELATLLGKDETLKRVKTALEML